MKLKILTRTRQLRTIMKMAWKLFRQGAGTFAESLKRAWLWYKNHAMLLLIVSDINPKYIPLI